QGCPMLNEKWYHVNQTAFRQLQSAIDETYPEGWFVAFYKGEIVADAETIQALVATLQEQGIDNRSTLVIQVGGTIVPSMSNCILRSSNFRLRLRCRSSGRESKVCSDLPITFLEVV